MVEDNLGPIRPQIVLFGIQNKALGDVLECGSRSVAVCMISKPEFIVPEVSENDPMDYCPYSPFL